MTLESGVLNLGDLGGTLVNLGAHRVTLGSVVFNLGVLEGHFCDLGGLFV